MQSFERFSNRGKAALNLAQEEALASNHHYIATEHLLLGLLRVKDGLAARVLEEFGVEIGDVRRRVTAVVGREERIVIQHTMPTARVRQVIEIAFTEARRLDCDYVGTEHLLLGILVEGEGIAARLLDERGVTLPRVRAQLSALSSNAPARVRVGIVAALPPTNVPHRRSRRPLPKRVLAKTLTDVRGSASSAARRRPRSR